AGQFVEVLFRSAVTVSILYGGASALSAVGVPESSITVSKKRSPYAVVETKKARRSPFGVAQSPKKLTTGQYSFYPKGIVRQGKKISGIHPMGRDTSTPGTLHQVRPPLQMAWLGRLRAGPAAYPTSPGSMGGTQSVLRCSA